jgi:hypothetical protein
MTEEDVRELVSRLPDVEVVIASEANGAPAVAWGDSFFTYHPPDSAERAHSQPFATLVTQDYPGFDTASDLGRPGVFRVNVAVGRETFTALFGHSPAAHAGHAAEYDYAVLDRLLPHPVYAAQGWACVLCPGEQTAAELETLLRQAHALAARRHHRRESHG